MAQEQPRRSRVTLAQVAERAGVSRSAAGFVLSGRRDQRIAAETWQRVEEAAAELGYRPNLTARTLRTGTSGTVAMISDHISTTSLANAMISGAMRALGEHGVLMLTAETLGDAQTQDRVIEEMLDRHVDGFLFATMFTRAVRVPETLIGRPVVLLNCVDESRALPTVVPDERGAGTAAGQALLEAGHDGVVHFVGSFPPGVTGTQRWHGATPLALAERLEGLRSVLDEVVTVDVATDWDVADGAAAVAGLLERGVVPRALVCANDRLAVGAYRALRAGGLEVPVDVSVVSFDDSPAAEIVTPPLTSVALPHEEMGREAVRMLLGETGGVRRVPMPLVTRQSVAPRS